MQRQFISGLLALCAGAGAVSLGQGASAASLYVVDGITLAKSLWLPRAYQCSPSEQFAQHSWCRLSRHEKGSRGAFTATTSVLRDQGRTVAYVNREIAPAFFAADEIEAEIERLSTRLGAPAREIRLAPREGAPKAVIVLWGKLQLEELTKKTASTDEPAGGPEKSLLVDYLGDVQQSRQLGLPVFRLAGGAGFLWSASDRNGRGHLRFLAADPAVLAGTKNLPSPTTERAPASAQEITEPAAKGRAHVAAATRDGAVPAAEREGTASIRAKDLRAFMAPQQPVLLSGGAANQDVTYSKDSSRVSIAQKTRPDADRTRMMDAERLAGEERERARLAWARVEAERVADARTRLTWTVVAAFFILSAIIVLLQMLKRREEKAALPEAGTETAKGDAASAPGWGRRARAQSAAALMKLRATFGSNATLAAQGQG
jgi:hypothetical protein